jgi:hypothetical protein
MRKELGATCSIAGCTSRALPGKGLCVEHQGNDVEIKEAKTTEPVVLPDEPKTLQKERSEGVQEYDPLIEGSRLAQRLIAEEEEERLKFWKEQAERSPGTKLKRRPPTRLAAKRPRLDMTAMKDPENGRPLVKAGHASRWVREVDSQGNPCDQRVEEMRAYGYEVIRTSNGEPLRGIFGVAMQAPIDRYAERIAINMPVGALNRNALLAEADMATKEVNRRAGEHVVSLVKEADHRRQRFEYGASDRLIGEE